MACCYVLQTGQKSSDRTNDQVKLYAQAIRDVGAKQGVPVLDLHALVNALPADKKAAWAFDGLHPSPEGQTMVFNAIKDALDNWQQFSSLRYAVGQGEMWTAGQQQAGACMCAWLNAAVPKALVEHPLARGVCS